MDDDRFPGNFQEELVRGRSHARSFSGGNDDGGSHKTGFRLQVSG
jgi:hypothetical protein